MTTKSMRSTKKITSLGSLALVLSASAIAFADGPTPADKDKQNTPRPIVPPPPFAQLPEGKTTTPPQEKAPKRIPKTEKVDGFFVADPPKTQRSDSGKITNVIVFSKEESAKDYTAGKGSSFGMGDETTCFAQPSRMGGFRQDDSPPSEWTYDIEPNARISAQMKPMAPPKKGEKPKPFKPEYNDMETLAIHQEKFIQEDKKARLEIVDAWVDPITHGVRQIAKASMPLERIGSAWHGIRLYAARGNKQIHVVARRDKPKEMNIDRPTKSIEFRMLNATRQSLTVEMPSGEMDSTQCGFSHVVLRAEPGAAETAMWESNTVFIEPPAPKEAKSEDDNGMGLPFRGRRFDEDMPTIRVRPFRATVSSTWSTQDKEPVISVSFGWAGREREM